MARALGVNLRTVQRWAAGQNETPEWVEREMTKTERYNGRDINVYALIVAAEKTLAALSDMTTEAFSLGADREARRSLAAALGLNPSDYSL